MKLRRTAPTDRPGLVRTVRIDRRVDQLVARANPGDIAVIDVIDLDRGTAERLVAAGVSAVVNASSSCSGRFPVHGAQTLLEAGVILLDDVGGEVFSRVRDGDTVRIEGSAVYAAGEQVVAGDLQSDATVAHDNASARDGMRARLGALVADAGRVLAQDDGRVLEGDAFPRLSTQLRDRVVVVVTSAASADDLRTAKRLVRRRRAVVIAVGGGADLARGARIRPDLVVIGRSASTRDGLTGAREVLVLDTADLDSPVPTGIPRAHATTFGSADDTAVLLAHTRGASLVVALGLDESLGGLLDRTAVAGSVPFLTRLRDGGRHLSSRGAATAFTRTRRVSVAFVALLAVLALALAAVGGAAFEQARSDDVAAAPVDTSVDEQAGAAQAKAFEATVVPVLLGDRLRGHAVQVVALPGAGSTAALTATMRQAGASTGDPIVLDADYLSPSRARVLRDLALQLAPASVQSRVRAEPAATPPASQLDELLASALVVPSVETVGGTDPAVGTLLTGLGQIGALKAPASGARTSDLVVLAVPPRASTAVASRTAGLAAAFARHGRTVVVVSTGTSTASAPAQGAVGAIRAGAQHPTVSTVDDGATRTGQVSAVLALSSVMRGITAGDYGSARGADAKLAPTGGKAGS